MSVRKLSFRNDEFFLLGLRIPVQNENSERARFHELLVQETMLAQKAQRKRIAWELLDHIGQNVYSIFHGLEVVKQTIKDAQYKNHVSNM